MKIVDGALMILKREHKIQDPVQFVYHAVEQAKPLIENFSMVVAGRRVPVPRPVYPKRQEGLALRYIRDAMRARKEHGSALRLANELLDLSNKQGGARKKRDDQHRIAESNRVNVK
eukprot:CAMPEP_0182441218 /NCGR_PEP_ID=MMETSP1172-20130603/174_1 /TAXON_ID=708627 /ORGANISM="Timspurckia oligopyrenoides, Strain CCMP3278" /LENGTH=115 /DNA_ID=CAMNT_0024635391 /DNA_START=140 /DNA_END=487 /DNA_ORIENTATION=+